MRVALVLALVSALATATAARADQSCAAAMGDKRAQALVDQCLEVSPATHPPCNAQNSCGLIIGEIKRGCDLLGDDQPDYCDRY